MRGKILLQVSSVRTIHSDISARQEKREPLRPQRPQKKVARSGWISAVAGYAPLTHAGASALRCRGIARPQILRGLRGLGGSKTNHDLCRHVYFEVGRVSRLKFEAAVPRVKEVLFFKISEQKSVILVVWDPDRKCEKTCCEFAYSLYEIRSDGCLHLLGESLHGCDV